MHDRPRLQDVGEHDDRHEIRRGPKRRGGYDSQKIPGEQNDDHGDGQEYHVEVDEAPRVQVVPVASLGDLEARRLPYGGERDLADHGEQEPELVRQAVQPDRRRVRYAPQEVSIAESEYEGGHLGADKRDAEAQEVTGSALREPEAHVPHEVARQERPGRDVGDERAEQYARGRQA